MLPNRLKTLLQRLAESKVDFVLVGGLAAVLNGAPVTTFDVDIVHSRTLENIARIMSFLESLDAIFRIQPERRLKPDASHLAGSGHLNLSTSLGPLDLLGEIGNKRFSYEVLLLHSSRLNIGNDRYIHVLKLETLIELKQELNAQKDIAMLGILKHTLDESRKKQP